MILPPAFAWHDALGQFLDAISVLGVPIQCAMTPFDGRPMSQLCKGQPVMPLPGDWPQRDLVSHETWHSSGSEPITWSERPALSTNEVLAFARAVQVAPFDSSEHAKRGMVAYLRCVLQCRCVFVRDGKLHEGNVLRQRLAPGTWLGYVCNATFWAYRELQGLRYHACLSSDAYVWASHPDYAAATGITDTLERTRASENISRLVRSFGQVLAGAPSGTEWSYESYDSPRDTVMPGILPLLEAEARRVRNTSER